MVLMTCLEILRKPGTLLRPLADYFYEAAICDEEFDLEVYFFTGKLKLSESDSSKRSWPSYTL